MKKIIITIIILAIIIAVGIKGKTLLEKRKVEVAETKIPQKESIKVSVIKPEKGEIQLRQKFLAQLEAKKSINISTKMAGYIEKLYIKEGDIVSKGQLLATIDENDLNSNIQLLQTTLSQQYNDFELAKQIYHRNKKLYDKGGLPKEQLDTSKVIMQGKTTLIKATKQKIKQLKEQKSYLKIKAPFNGEIDHIALYKGDLSVMGKPILIMNNGVKKLTFSYSLSNSHIQKGQKVFYKGENIGEITLIKTLAKQGLSQAEIVLTKQLNIPIGSSINIEVLTKKAIGCIIPNETIIHKKKSTFIMVYKNKKFEPFKIDIVLKNSQKAILSNCPKAKIAIGNEVELAQLGAYNSVEIIGESNE